MNEKKIIANILLEIAKNSTTELIEDAQIDQEIIDSAKKMGMIIPSPDFAIFKTKWADIGKSNLNKIRLPKKAVEEGIQSLVGKNLNFEHQGAYNVCGFCLSVKIKKDEIECIQVFYKSLYPDKFEELKEKIKTKEAAVSFEIWNRNEKGESVVKELSDGTKEITKIHCHGTGLLLVNPPACPTAKIFKLVAKNELLEEAENIANNVFAQDLIYASLAIEEKEEDKVDIEKTEGKLPEETKTEVKADETKPVDAGAETKPVETKVEETKEAPKVEAETKVEEPKVEAETKVEETKAEAETKVEEPKVEEKAEVKAQELQVIEPKVIVKLTRIYSEVAIDTYVDGTASGTSEQKAYSKTITEYKDGTKDEIESEVTVEKKYSFAELEEAVKKAKDEKDVEITSLKAELETVKAAKETEVSTLKAELETVKAKKDEIKTPLDLEVGEVKVKGEDEYVKIRKNIDKKAFGEKK